MRDEIAFRAALCILLVLIIVIGVPHRLNAASSGERISHRQEGYVFAATLRISGLLLWMSTLAYLLFPSTVAWASIPLPLALRWCGAIVGAACTAFLYWTLSTLGKNLTDTAVTRRDAVLVTQGPYGWVRHPFYVCAALLMVATTTLTANGLIGISSVLVLTLLALRTPKEEQMLIRRFGEGYRNYMKTTGKFFTRLGGRGFRGRN